MPVPVPAAVVPVRPVVVMGVDEIAVPVPISSQLLEKCLCSHPSMLGRNLAPLRGSRLDSAAMRGLAPKLLALAAALAALLVSAGSALAAPHFDGSFKVSATGANNLKMVEGPDGNVWMTLEGSTKDVAKISPSGSVTEYEFGAAVEPPTGIAVGPEKAMWVTTTKGVATFATADPTKAVETPITGITGNSSIVAGPNGEMWVATTNAVFHFKPENPAGAKEVPVAGLTPHDIDVAGSLLVIADSAKGRIVTMTTGGTEGKVAFVNNPTGTSQGVAGGAGGQFAFSESDGKEGLALATPPNPAAAELRNVGDPFGVALGSDGAYYFAMAGDDNVRRLVPGSPSTVIDGFPKEFFPRQITAGPNNTMWVAMEIPGKNIVEVARISGLELPVPPPPPPGPIPPSPTPPVIPNTLLGKKPKSVVKARAATAPVKFSFSAIGVAAGFECSLAHRVTPKGKAKGKKPRFVGGRFKGCKSPKTYTLKPGSYRFQVRAVGTGGRDSSPAKCNFKVIHVAHK